MKIWRKIGRNFRSAQSCVKYIGAVLQYFCNRFYVEYTAAHRKRSLYSKTKTSDQLLKKNDVVVIREAKSVPRLLWEKRKIENFLYGKDGYVRSELVKLQNNKRYKFTFVNRPGPKIVPLEVYRS